MKMKVRSVAFAMLLAPTTILADFVNVTFDAALTNTTEWTYVGNIKTNKNGDYYINGQDVRIISPSYNLAITSVVLRISTSEKCTRNLIISAYDSQTSILSHEFTAIPQGTSSDITATWNITDRVRTLAITSTSGAQNLYFHSAVISGVPIIEAPANPQVNDIKGTRCRLSWTNPANAVSNRVEVSSVKLAESTGTTVEEFGFNEISAGGNAVNFAKFRDSLPQHYEKLSGTYLYAAANSTGLLHISTGKNRGELVYSGYESYSGLTLMLTLKRYSGDSNTMTIGWTDGGATTNTLKTVNLADEFMTEFVDLSSVADGARIVFNNSGNDDNHRVIIDEIAFVRDYSPAIVSTNLVKTVFTTGNTATTRGLSPRSSYIASITAFDVDGNESDPSEPISFMTDNNLPFVLKLQ